LGKGNGRPTFHQLGYRARQRALPRTWHRFGYHTEQRQSISQFRSCRLGVKKREKVNLLDRSGDERFLSLSDAGRLGQHDALVLKFTRNTPTHTLSDPPCCHRAQHHHHHHHHHHGPAPSPSLPRVCSPLYLPSTKHHDDSLLSVDS
jgi:hypothetical protein